MISVNKGNWDKSNGHENDYKFTLKWLKAFDEFLKDFKAMRYPGYGWRYIDKEKKKERQ